ncbi:AsmA family protein [Roseospira marina]|uniref:AsmA family protein n=1 Tax=Roseospira marina TaxID=140057 RepID=A0A5M6IIU7_9PROT|nr:AsmA family protein [Roseospira marina]KAA5607635.1 AsmA family protein [Roseospira marina]MBB4312165.1 hypothetical protein [Roseospira marina]MBB5085819.1 hypothetical protein [Roseospira marina]
MKISTLVKVLLGLIVLAIGALGVFIATLDVSQYKGRIVALLEQKTGRTVTIDGDLDLAIGLSPALVVEDVTIGNADWASDPEMLSVGRLEAQVEMLPLLSGDINIVRVILDDPIVHLETDKDGNGNWALSLPTDAADATEPPLDTASTEAPADGAEGPGGLPALQIQEVRLENGMLTYRDGVTGQTMAVALDTVSLTGGGLADPLNIEIEGAYNDAEFTLDGSVGAPAALTNPNGTAWPLDLTATAGGATVTAKGTIAHPAEATGIDLAITARGEQIADLATLAQAFGQSVAIPALGPYTATLNLAGDADALAVRDLDAKLGTPGEFLVAATGSIANALAASGLDLTVSVAAPDPDVLADFGAALPAAASARAVVRDIDGGYGLRDLEATLGRSALSGTLDARMDGPRPAVSGSLSSSLLDLDELASTPDGDSDGTVTVPAAPAAPTDSGGPMIPDTPLPLDALRLADANLSLAVERAILPGGGEVSDLSLNVTLDGGALSISPMQANVAGGAMDGSVTLRPTGNGAARLAVDMNGDGVRVGDLAKAFAGSEAVLDGPTTLRVKLEGQGATPHQIASTLDGSILVHTVDARMNNGAVNWAGGDVMTQLGELINPFAAKESTTPIQCLVFNMTATQGVLSNDNGVAMETDKMVVGGGGAFDLGAERLNVKIAPRPRPGIGIETGFGKIVELFAVTGPFASPSLELDAEKAIQTGLRTAASAAGAVATGGLSMLGESLVGGMLGSEGGELEPCLVALGEKDPGQGGSAAGAESGSPTDGVGQALEGLTGGESGDVGRAIENILGGGQRNAPAEDGGTGGETGESGDGDVGEAIREGLGGLLGD